MQIEITSPAQGQALPPIEWNFEAVKQWVETGLKKYENIVYTEDDIPQAKKDRADLNKLSKAIDDKRKEMKKQYLAPYEEFERQAKYLTGLIDKQSNMIDAQVKEYEEVEKQKKQDEIKAIYEEVAVDLKGLIPYEAIHDKKWLNKGTSIAKVKEAIETVIARTKTAFTAIDAMGLDEKDTNRCKGVYVRTFDLADAIAEKERIEEENRKLAELKAKNEAARKAAEEKQLEEIAIQAEMSGIAGESGVVEAANELARQMPAEVKEDPAEALIQIDFRVWATKEQLNILKAFLNNNNIKYGRVE